MILARRGLGQTAQVQAIATAFATAESGLTPGTFPYRTNNPCDIFVGEYGGLRHNGCGLERLLQPNRTPCFQGSRAFTRRTSPFPTLRQVMRPPRLATIQPHGQIMWPPRLGSPHQIH